MNAAAGSRFADARLVRRAVDVNVTLVGIHVPAAIESGFKPFQPQNARGDFGVGEFRLRRVADGLARLEDSSRRRAIADLFGNAVQSQRRAVRAFCLSDTKARGGAGKFFYEFVFLKKQNSLLGDTDSENELPWGNSIFFAS